ncbi:MAG: hypothetical protein Q9178_007155 [Gyalolechia marmorata]
MCLMVGSTYVQAAEGTFDPFAPPQAQVRAAEDPYAPRQPTTFGSGAGAGAGAPVPGQHDPFAPPHGSTNQATAPLAESGAPGGTPNDQFATTPGASSLETTTSPKCPESNNTIYRGYDGGYYHLQCNKHGWYGTLKTVHSTSYQGCMDLCTQEIPCVAINHDRKNQICYLMKEAKPGDTKCVAHDFAYSIDPPVFPQANSADFVLCSTDCPSADGMTYSSRHGETFRMSCGKRHGAVPIFQEAQKSLRDCMNACAAILACHSVDYYQKTGACYYSDRHGEPQIDAPGFQSAHSMGCAGACTCSQGCNGASGQPTDPSAPEQQATTGGPDDAFAPPQQQTAGGQPEDPFAPPQQQTAGAQPEDPFAPPQQQTAGGQLEDPFAPPQQRGGSGQQATGTQQDDPFAPRQPTARTQQDDPFAPRQPTAGTRQDDPFAPRQQTTLGARSDDPFAPRQ